MEETAVCNWLGESDGSVAWKPSCNLESRAGTGSVSGTWKQGLIWCRQGRWVSTEYDSGGPWGIPPSLSVFLRGSHRRGAQRQKIGGESCLGTQLDKNVGMRGSVCGPLYCGGRVRRQTFVTQVARAREHGRPKRSLSYAPACYGLVRLVARRRIDEEEYSMGVRYIALLYAASRATAMMAYLALTWGR